MVLPSEWTSCTIKDIQSVEVQNGFSPQCVEYETARKSLSLGALTGFSLDLTQEKYISEKAELPLNSMLHKNDILVSRSNTKDKVGRAAVVLEDVVEYYYPDLMMRFQVDSQKADCRYVAMYLQSPMGRNYFMSHAAGTSTSMVKINKNVLESFPMVLPPLAEQKKIAETLSVWDSAIEKMEKLIKFKEANKKRLISTLIDFAAESKKNITNTIKIDGVIIDKSKWRKCKLSEIASGFEYGMNAAAKEYDGKNKYIRITDIDENTHRFNAKTLVSPNGLLDKKYLVNSGDILFARTGASTGKSYLYNENDGLLYYAGFLIRVNIESENSHFIYLQTLTSDYQNWVKKMSARSGQPGINAEEYKELPIVLPSRKEQDAISNYLTKIEKEILLLTQQLALYKKQKQGLMQKLLTGEWRV